MPGYETSGVSLPGILISTLRRGSCPVGKSSASFVNFRIRIRRLGIGPTGKALLCSDSVCAPRRRPPKLAAPLPPSVRSSENPRELKPKYCMWTFPPATHDAGFGNLIPSLPKGVAKRGEEGKGIIVLMAMVSVSELIGMHSSHNYLIPYGIRDRIVMVQAW